MNEKQIEDLLAQISQLRAERNAESHAKLQFKEWLIEIQHALGVDAGVLMETYAERVKALAADGNKYAACLNKVGDILVDNAGEPSGYDNLITAAKALKAKAGEHAHQAFKAQVRVRHLEHALANLQMHGMVPKDLVVGTSEGVVVVRHYNDTQVYAEQVIPLHNKTTHVTLTAYGAVSIGVGHGSLEAEARDPERNPPAEWLQEEQDREYAEPPRPPEANNCCSVCGLVFKHLTFRPEDHPICATCDDKAAKRGPVVLTEGDLRPNAVNHPWHYGGDTTYECIKVLEAWGLVDSFCLGNAVKYIARAGKKNAATALEDLEKARWYLDREIARRKE